MTSWRCRGSLCGVLPFSSTMVPGGSTRLIVFYPKPAWRSWLMVPAASRIRWIFAMRTRRRYWNAEHAVKQWPLLVNSSVNQLNNLISKPYARENLHFNTDAIEWSVQQGWRYLGAFSFQDIHDFMSQESSLSECCKPWKWSVYILSWQLSAEVAQGGINFRWSKTAFVIVRSFGTSSSSHLQPDYKISCPCQELAEKTKFIFVYRRGHFNDYGWQILTDQGSRKGQRNFSQ